MAQVVFRPDEVGLLGTGACALGLDGWKEVSDNDLIQRYEKLNVNVIKTTLLATCTK